MHEHEPEQVHSSASPMAWSNLLEYKGDLIRACLAGLTLFLLILLAILSIIGHIPRDLWVVTGLSCMLLLIMHERQGAGTFICILAISTLVAREEFLLEVAALSRGESLASLRESRVIPMNDLSDDEEGDNTLLQSRLAELIEAGKTPQEIYAELELYRTQLDVDRDKDRISNIQHKILSYLAQHGMFTDETYTRLIERNDLDKESVDDALEELLGSGYITYKESLGKNVLTEKGVSLAKAIGLEVDETMIPALEVKKPK